MGLLMRYGKEILKTDCQHTVPYYGREIQMYKRV